MVEERSTKGQHDVSSAPGFGEATYVRWAVSVIPMSSNASPDGPSSHVDMYTQKFSVTKASRGRRSGAWAMHVMLTMACAAPTVCVTVA